MRPRRAAISLAVPVAAALALGSLVIAHGDDAAQLAAARGRIAHTAAAGLPNIAASFGAGTADGADDAQSDLAATQDIAFSTPVTHAKAPAGVGLARQSPAKIRTAVARALAAARSVHIRGVVPSDGQDVAMDFRISKEAAEGTGTFREGTIEIRRIGTTIYLRGDDKLYTNAGVKQGAIGQGQGKWGRTVPGDRDYAGLAALTYLKTYAAIAAKAQYSGRKPGPALGGVPTVIIFGGRGPKAESVYVATTGPAYPLYVSTRDKKSHLAFYDWDQSISVEEPDADSVFPLP